MKWLDKLKRLHFVRKLAFTENEQPEFIYKLALFAIQVLYSISMIIDIMPISQVT